MGKYHRRCLHSTVCGAALNSNHYLVKICTTFRTKTTRRKKPKPRKTLRPTEEEKEHYNRQVASRLRQPQPPPLPVCYGADNSVPASTAPHSQGRLKTRSPRTTPRQHTTHRVLTHTGRRSGKPAHSHSPRPSRRNIRRRNSRGVANSRGTSYNTEYKQGKQVTKPQSRTSTSKCAHRRDKTKHSGSRTGWRKARRPSTLE